MALRVTTTISGGQSAPYFNRLHFDDFNGDQTSADAAVATVRQFWVLVAPSMSNTLSIQIDPEVFLVNNGTGEPEAVFVTTAAAVTGGNAGDRLPSLNQLLVQFRTGVFVGGREVRGRMFIPGLAEDNNTLGRPSAGVRTLVANAAQAELVENTPAVGILGMNGFTEATSATVWNEWAYLTTRRD